MKTKYLHLLAGITMIVLCISVLTATTTAATVWSEDFADMTEWTTTAFVTWQSGPIVEGNFSVIDGKLTVMDDDVNYARHDSAVTEGTWSFDMFVPDIPHGYVGVSFMSNGSRPLELDSRWIAVEATMEGLDRFNFWWQRGPDNWVGDICYTPTGSILGWHHIDITRTSGGTFNLFFNGSFEYTTLTNDVTQSTYLECYGVNATGAMFDNIVVDDDPGKITPPTTPPTTPTAAPLPWDLIAIGGGVAVVVIVLAIVCLRRR
jgi:hypothetical protein